MRLSHERGHNYVLVFMLLLLLFLIFDVMADYLLVNANRIDKVAPRRKMVAPIGLLLQAWITLKQLDGKLALEKSLEAADGNLHRY